MGYRKNTTPHIDKFSDESVLFTKCFAQSSSTLSSHASILTSLIPSHHGASYARKTPLPKKIVTMAEILKTNGFKTISFNNGGQVAPCFGLGQGFHIYRSKQRTFDKFYFRDIVKDTIEWLESNSDERFFLFLHTYETHTPYTPNKEYLDLFETQYEGKLPMHTLDDLALVINRGQLKITDEDLKHIINTYNAEIRSMDDSFQRFLDYLKRRSLFDNTMIIFTSDHGEEFREHGMVAEHSHTLYNELLHVPLMIKFDRSRYSSKIIRRHVRSVDIMPTVLDILNIEDSIEVDGMSLMPMINGRQQGFEQFVIAERDMEECLKPQCWSVIRGRWKLYNTCLYDLERDPGETVDVSDDHMDIKRTLRRGALRYMQRNRIMNTRKRAEIDKEELERLRSLGYIK
jgi:arylsulfatase A-like enzyme